MAIADLDQSAIFGIPWYTYEYEWLGGLIARLVRDPLLDRYDPATAPGHRRSRLGQRRATP